MKMIEVRMTTVSLASSIFARSQAGKGSMPKAVEAQGPPGNSENIRFTVAFCGELSKNKQERSYALCISFWVADS